MITKSFSVDIPRVMFKEMYWDYCGTYAHKLPNGYKVPDRNDEKLTATQTTSTVTLSWSKVKSATGYRVYMYNSTAKKWVKIKNPLRR